MGFAAAAAALAALFAFWFFLFSSRFAFAASRDFEKDAHESHGGIQTKANELSSEIISG